MGLPGFSQNSPFRFYTQPHFGDFLHRDYVRVPVGVRFKYDQHIELYTEIEGYFTTGFGDTSAGYGLSRFRVGIKHDSIMSMLHMRGFSAGFDFDTPLARPPLELTDGHRHYLPYVSYTKSLKPEWRLVGYTGIGANFLEHTALPANFGKNELHSNSLNFSAGVSRDWSRFRATFTTIYSTTALLSDEQHHVITLRPDFLIPLTRHPEINRTHLLFTIGAHAQWGPDGQDIGASSSLRIEFASKPKPVTQ